MSSQHSDKLLVYTVMAGITKARLNNLNAKKFGDMDSLATPGNPQRCNSMIAKRFI